MSEQYTPPQSEIIKRPQPTPEEFSNIFFYTFEFAQGDPRIDPKISRYLAAQNPDWRMSQVEQVKTFFNFIWSAAKKTDSQHVIERVLSQFGKKNNNPIKAAKEIISPDDRQSHLKITPKERYDTAIYNLNILKESLNNQDKQGAPTAADIAHDILGRENTILFIKGGRSAMRNTPESRDNHLSYFTRYVLTDHKHPCPQLQPLVDEMRTYIHTLIQDPERAKQMRTIDRTPNSMSRYMKPSVQAEPMDLSYLRKISNLHLDAYPKDKETLDPLVSDWLTKPAPATE